MLSRGDEGRAREGRRKERRWGGSKGKEREKKEREEKVRKAKEGTQNNSGNSVCFRRSTVLKDGCFPTTAFLQKQRKHDMPDFTDFFTASHSVLA